MPPRLRPVFEAHARQPHHSFQHIENSRLIELIPETQYPLGFEEPVLETKISFCSTTKRAAGLDIVIADYQTDNVVRITRSSWS